MRKKNPGLFYTFKSLKLKLPVRFGSAGGNTLLMRQVRGERPDAFTLTGRVQGNANSHSLQHNRAEKNDKILKLKADGVEQQKTTS